MGNIMSAPIGYSPDDPLDTVDLEILADLARISAMLDLSLIHI